MTSKIKNIIIELMEETGTNKSYGYGKRPIWQWVVIYLVIAVILYGAFYYFFLAKKGGYY